MRHLPARPREGPRGATCGARSVPICPQSRLTCECREARPHPIDALDVRTDSKVASARHRGRILADRLPSVAVPELQPFRALRYDTSAVPDLSSVLCPPYDVIDAAERARLVALDPHNAVNLELPIGYDAAAATFESWIGDGTLRLDDRPLIYIYEQRFARPGRRRAGRAWVLLPAATRALRPGQRGSAARAHDGRAERGSVPGSCRRSRRTSAPSCSCTTTVPRGHGRRADGTPGRGTSDRGGDSDPAVCRTGCGSRTRRLRTRRAELLRLAGRPTGDDRRWPPSL